MGTEDIYKRKSFRSVMQNSLWNHDYYPDLPDLEPHSTLEIGRFRGPGVVRTIHLTLNIEGGSREELLRGCYLSVVYNEASTRSVYAPVGDFFCDSFAGQSISFATSLMAKRPTNSLFCYIPMPFEKEVCIELVNSSDKTITGYGYVTAEQVPSWEPDNLYFHARWTETHAQLPNDQIPLLETEGSGHFLGCHLTVTSDCTHFAENQGICEGNDEFFVDGALEPTCNYLGTEDFFGFSWNWRELWCDDYSGTTFLDDTDGITKLACYRFLLNDPVRFDSSLRARINYNYELKNLPLQKANLEKSGQVQFRTVAYWYQSRPVSAEHE